jgi:6-phosphogluconolactonase
MNQFVGRIQVLADPPALARRAAEWMTATASAAKGRFRVALSGGSTPKALYSLLASEEFRDRFPWRQVSWFWGDERFVPYDHPESNYRMTREAMLAKAPVPPENIYPVPTDGEPEEAARRYERTLQEAYGAPTLDPSRPFFDIVLLGMGPDGHTASLLPGDKLLAERDPRRRQSSTRRARAPRGRIAPLGCREARTPVSGIQSDLRRRSLTRRPPTDIRVHNAFS